VSNGLGTGLREGLSSAFQWGFAFGLVGLFTSILLAQIGETIQPAEIIVWSWKDLGRNLFTTKHLKQTAQLSLVAGFAAGISIGFDPLLVTWPKDLIGVLSYGIGSTLSIGISYWLLIGLRHGISSKPFDPQQRLVPNQGIHACARNGMRLGTISVYITSLACMIGIALRLWLAFTLSYGISIGQLLWSMIGSPLMLPGGTRVGLLCGLLIAIQGGGFAYYQHGILRLLLWLNNVAPWNYPRFLDETATRILLYRTGGCYRFIHPLFHEYLATLDASNLLFE
jgi:hypothetical protein